MTSAIGRLVVDVLTNKSGGAVAYGDVVVLDSANDDAFTTDSSGAYTGIVGVCIEPNGIASNNSGRIQTQGPVAQINCSASVTRGHYLKTHTVAKQAADAGTSRVVGAFAKTKTTSATPKAILFGFPDAASSSASAGTPALTLSTTNSAGAAATFVATDATVAVFDATAPTTQAFGDAAATGSAGTAARRDHKHAMPAMSESENFLTGDVTITSADTFYDGPSLSLNGTYYVFGSVCVVGRAGGQDAASAKLWNGTTVKATGETQTAGASAAVQIPLSAWVVTSGAETWKISCATNNGGASIKATLPHNGTTNKASYLIAIKIA